MAKVGVIIPTELRQKLFTAADIERLNGLAAFLDGGQPLRAVTADQLDRLA